MNSVNSARAARQLTMENGILCDILDKIPFGVTVNDTKGNFLFINRAAEDMYDIDRDVAVNKRDRTVFQNYMSDESFGYQEGSPFLNEIVCASGEAIEDVPVAYTTPSGGKYYTIVSAYPHKTDGALDAIYYITSELKYARQMSNMARNLRNVFQSHNNSSTRYHFEDFITEDPEMLSNLEMARRAAATELPVMIVGETGTGKEIIAQSIHVESARGNGDFVPINCAAIPEGLVENIFFGSVKGAYTDATDMPGLFEQAKDGTVFLDEVNSLPLAFQAKLLRVLQEKRVRRVGGDKEIPIRCRIISATNEDLAEKDDWSKFRQDLFFRLAVVTIPIKPLRDRECDILTIAQRNIDRANLQLGKSIEGFDEVVREFVLRYAWPGNVRELQNLIVSSMSLIDPEKTVIGVEDVPARYRKAIEACDFSGGADDGGASPSQGSGVSAVPPADASERPVTRRDPEEAGSRGPRLTLATRVEGFERVQIEDALAKSAGNVSKAARELGIQRSNLYAKMKKYGIGRSGD